jgi:sporulation-control protein
MFKRLLSAFGVGGPSVDTVLDSPHATPGEVITGQVRIQGGSSDVEIGQVVLSLVTRVEVEHGDRESSPTAEFHRVVVAQGVRIAAGQPLAVPFSLSIPWETPITAVGSTHLHGMTVGVRTELVIAGAPDKGDLDPISVHPLPSQDRVLDAFGELGFQFRKADVEAGHLHGVPQELGFYQEIEFFPPAQFGGAVNQVELTFVANPHELYVVLEADKRGGMFSSGSDAFGHFALSHQEAQGADWTAIVSQWLSEVASRSGGHGGYGHYEEHGGRRGPGMGAMVGGVAAGVVGGLVLGEVFEEVGESFGDFEE